MSCAVFILFYINLSCCSAGAVGSAHLSVDPLLFFFAGFFTLESMFEYDDSGAVANLQHKHVTRNVGFHLGSY